MMDINSFKTADQLWNAIMFDMSLGIQPSPEALARYNELKTKEAEEQAQQAAQQTTTATQAEDKVVDSDHPIYDTLCVNFPHTADHKLPQVNRDCIESTVEQLLADVPNAEDPGLLLGRIQCGKTATFEGIIGLAFDEGIDICVVMTKGTKMLSEQTKSRFEKDYHMFQNSSRANIDIYDIMKINSLSSWRVNNNKTLIVCKKQKQNLDRLTKLFEGSEYLLSKKVLIVDDEADFASRNYQNEKQQAQADEEGNILLQDDELKLACIAQQIDYFRGVPDYCRYLLVTATPYCLYLQPKGELYLQGNRVKSFRPRFTSLVPVHDRYVGGQQYFIDSQDPESMYSHLYHKVTQKCLDVMGHEDKRYVNNPISSANIFDLTYGLIAYLMATAVRVLQNEAEGNMHYHSSALIHVDIDKDKHGWQKKLVTETLAKIRKAFVDESREDMRICQAMDIVWDDFVESNRKGREAVDEEGNPKPLITVELPEKDTVIAWVKKMFVEEMYAVKVVNSDEDVTSMLNNDGELDLADGVANIFIGGNILDRGITIKNMLCFFYGRNPGTAQQDTVIQHARMYGNRSKEDMAVMRLHTSERIYKILRKMNELDDMLRQWFVDGKDLEEPNAIFCGYDKNFVPCAPSKIKASNPFSVSEHKFFVPSGQFTHSKTKIEKNIQKIQNLIEASPDYANQDADGFFMIDKSTVFEIIRLIEETYVYDNKYYNMDHKNDLQEMMCAIQQCVVDDKLYCLHRTDRNMGRLREDGRFIDAPLDGRTDSAPGKRISEERPVIFFIKQNGEKRKNNIDDINYGWNDAPFYWPVFLTAKNTQRAMCAIDASRTKQKYIYDLSQILEGIDMSKLLKVKVKADDTTINEGGVLEYSLKQRIASKFISKDPFTGKFELADGVEDSDGSLNIYSLNNEKFPYILREYTHLLAVSSSSEGTLLRLFDLHEQDKWEISYEVNINENGDLIDRDTLDRPAEDQKVLLHCSDTLTDENLQTTEYMKEDVCQWVLNIGIKNLIKTQVITYAIPDEEFE